MDATLIPDYARGATLEDVWAALRENAELFKQIQKENDRMMKESQEKWEKSSQEWEKKWEKSKQEWDRRFGNLNNRFGEIVEHMIAPNLCEKFREMGFDFHRSSSPSKVRDYDNNIFFEVDVMLENGDKALLVEIKTKPSTEDVQDHIERLEKMRKYADLHGDKRTFLGAVAGVVMADNVKKFILKQGFYAIEPSGETFNITPPNNKPKEW